MNYLHFKFFSRNWNPLCHLCSNERIPLSSQFGLHSKSTLLTFDIIFNLISLDSESDNNPEWRAAIQIDDFSLYPVSNEPNTGCSSWFQFKYTS